MQGNGKGHPTKPAACIDAETLAAWADGGLSKPDAAAVEVHLADCDRCRAMVATFARSIPEAPVAESLWKRWHLRWLVPVATAATVASLWVLLPDQQTPGTVSLRAPTTETPQTQATPQQPAEQTLAAPESPPAPAVESRDREFSSRARPSAPVGALAKREEAPRVGDERQEEDRAKRVEQQAQNSVQETITVPPPAAQAQPQSQTGSVAREADRADKAAADAQAKERFAPTVPAPGAATAGAAAAAAPAGAAAAAAPPALTAEEGRRGLTSTMRREASAIPEIVSPDSMTRWRILGTGQVERSTTGGAKWEPATLPQAATLTGGSSPSPSICWLIGRAGAIYVTTDGLRFIRVPFPDRTDLLSIQAMDGQRATVVTSDGRRLRTEDRGANWTRTAP